MRMGEEDDEEGWMMGWEAAAVQAAIRAPKGHRITQGDEHAMSGTVKCLGVAVECEMAHLKGWSQVA